MAVDKSKLDSAVDSTRAICVQNLENSLGGYRAGIVVLIIVSIIACGICFHNGYKYAISPKESFVRNCMNNEIDKKTCESRYYKAKQNAEESYGY